MTEFIEASAVFTDDGRFRFQLIRRWSDGPLVHGCFLNPSVADAKRLDNTLTRFMGFAMHWNMGGFVITNVAPLVSTDPRGLRASDCFGPFQGMRYENHDWIEASAKLAAFTVAGWGTNAERYLPGAVQSIMRGPLRGRDVRALRVTKHGHPEHPLYLPGDLEPRPWKAT